MSDLRDRFRGCLLGQCLGDASGFPVEGHGPDECGAWVDRFLRTPGIPAIGRRGFPFGQYTDDSQLARELLQSFVGCRRFDPADYARRISLIFLENRIVGRGRATEEAAARLSRGVAWERAGAPPPNAGNGSAMRAGVVGLVARDENELVEIAVNQGRITHQDPRCSAGSVAIAGAVWMSLRDGGLDFGRLASLVERVDPSVAAAVRRVAEVAKMPWNEAVPELAPLGKDPSQPEKWPGISPFVTGSVAWSLFASLASSYDEAICTAILPGGDVDTTAAMTGAIVGARVGLAELPADRVRTVQDQGTWGFDELVALADEAFAIVQKSE